MKVLVTGGAGYIGSVLVPTLLREGWQVTVLDSFLYRQNSLLDCCHDRNLTLVRGDVRDERALAECIRGADVLLPLACLTGAPLCDREPISARQVNLEAVRSVIRLRSKNQRILFPTTNSGYGVGEADAHCTEESPLRPVSLYGRLKVEAEQAVLEVGNSLTFRLATAFGISPRMRLDLLVNDFVYRAVTDGFLVLFQGHFRRNFIHVRDISAAFLHGIKQFDSMQGRPYNVGLSEANLTKKQLCEEIHKQVPRFYFTEAEVGEDPDKRDYRVSNERIEKTGFRPAVSLSEGIAELIRGYQIIRARNGYANV